MMTAKQSKFEQSNSSLKYLLHHNSNEDSRTWF